MIFPRWMVGGRWRLGGLLLVCLSTLSANCATAHAPGWYRILPNPGVSYGASFHRTPLVAASSLCPRPSPAGESAGAPAAYVFVPGFEGDGDEWHDIPPLLAATRPEAIFMYAWNPDGVHDRVEGRFAAGVSRLAACLEGRGPIVVLAHSAGGIMVSYAARRIRVPARGEGPAVYVLTVAAPLADVVDAIGPYPRAAPGVAVAHLRTSYPADPHMKPEGGQSPDDPSVGVPGAPQVALPADLSHDASLLYAARRLADGSWRAWFSGGR